MSRVEQLAAEYNAGANSFRTYELFIAIKREELVRSGQTAPKGEDEARQALEGPKPHREFDCVARWANED